MLFSNHHLTRTKTSLDLHLERERKREVMTGKRYRERDKKVQKKHDMTEKCDRREKEYLSKPTDF